jgi:hypothetical protein
MHAVNAAPGPVQLGRFKTIRSTFRACQLSPGCLGTSAGNMAQACRFEFENDRGQKLHGVEFVPVPSNRQVATLIWNHGICEHKERYVPGEHALLAY